MDGHIVYSWLLDCGHGVTCGCRHKIGGQAFCWICRKQRIVKEKETRRITDSKKRKEQEHA